MVYIARLFIVCAFWLKLSAANSSTLVVATCSDGYPPFVIPDGQGGYAGYDLGIFCFCEALILEIVAQHDILQIYGIRHSHPC